MKDEENTPESTEEKGKKMWQLQGKNLNDKGTQEENVEK